MPDHSQRTQGSAVTIVEVGPRDGFQSIAPFIPTDRKRALIEQLYLSGLRRIEIGSFVSAAAIPQLRDTAQLLDLVGSCPGLDAQILVPSVRRASAALDAGATHLSFVLSVSEAHNRNNVRRHPDESVQEYADILKLMPAATTLRLNLATAFDCPFEGRVPLSATLALLDRLVPLDEGAEICLCDTTGRATPDQVGQVFAVVRERFPAVSAWAFHGHDTYGLGLANVYAAYREGVGIMDASFAGLGGCPFAPGATGNVATEDVVWMFDRMQVATGIRLDALLPVTCDGEALPGASSGGRARRALTASALSQTPAQ